MLSASSGAKYLVTRVSGKKRTVTYQSAASGSAKTVSVPKTVKLWGVTYQVTAIADGALAGNQKLTKLTIGSNVTSIGKNACGGCTKLKSVTIGSGVTAIGAKAFYHCKSLKTLVIKTKKLSAKQVGKDAFAGVYTKVKVSYPSGKKKTYQALLKKKGLR